MIGKLAIILGILSRRVLSAALPVQTRNRPTEPLYRKGTSGPSQEIQLAPIIRADGHGPGAALNLFQRTVDRRELGIYSGCYSGDSDENAKSDACGDQAVFNSRYSILVRNEAAKS
jgi:hypothetical protein